MARYVANGLVATVVHFLVLTLCLEVLDFPSAGAANFVAAIFGVGASFTGNRYLVFRRFERSVLQQAWRFAAVYAAIAVFHGIFLYVWADLLLFDYRVGFLIAMLAQVIFGYLGNRRLVFQ